MAEEGDEGDVLFWDGFIYINLQCSSEVTNSQIYEILYLFILG